VPDDPEDTEDPIAVLRAEVAALRDEVRTRRVVVVDAAGRPRIVLSADPGVGSVRVDAEGGDPSVELYAVDAIDADGPEVGIALVVGGDVVRRLGLGPTVRDGP
jgi:hypothetical protein